MSGESGRMRFTSTVGLCLVFVAIFFSAAGVAALNYPPGAASLPIAIGSFAGCLSLLQLLIELRKSRGAFEERVDLRRDLPIYGWVWAFVLAIVAFGFLIAAPPMLFLYLRLRSKEPWRVCLALSLGVLALLYGLFQVALSVPLFDGLLTPIIGDWLVPS